MALTPLLRGDPPPAADRVSRLAGEGWKVGLSAVQNPQRIGNASLGGRGGEVEAGEW